jgi:hypothetical protein
MKWIILFSYLILQSSVVHAEETIIYNVSKDKYETIKYEQIDEYHITKKQSKKLLLLDDDTYLKPTYGKDNLRDDEGFQLKLQVVHKF